MARLELLPEMERRVLEVLACPTFETQPWVDGPPLNQRRVAIISTAGLHRRDDRPFTFLGDKIPDNPRDDIALPFMLKLATDDLKAYYSEAITAQPGQESPSSHVISDCFYEETMAGKILFAIQGACNKSENGLMKMVGNALVIPVDQLEKRMKKPS